MARNKTPIPDDFLELKQQLAEWRSSHRRQTPLPEEFWKAAVELARKHGVHRTARWLPVDYANLRKRLNVGPSGTGAAPGPQFLELFPETQPSDIGQCVEILRVPLSSTSAANWSQFLRAWRQSG